MMYLHDQPFPDHACRCIELTPDCGLCRGCGWGMWIGSIKPSNIPHTVADLLMHSLFAWKAGMASLNGSTKSGVQSLKPVDSLLHAWTQSSVYTGLQSWGRRTTYAGPS